MDFRELVAHAFNLALKRQKQAYVCVLDNPSLQSEFQGSQGYTEKSCLKKTTKQKQQQNILSAKS